MPFMTVWLDLWWLDAFPGAVSHGGVTWCSLDESIAMITSSTMISWITQAATKQRCCSLASARLHPSNLFVQYAGTHNCRHIKKLIWYNTHTYQQYPGQTLSFWAEAVWKYLCSVTFHPQVSFTCCCYTIIILGYWITQLVQMAENNCCYVGIMVLLW